MPLEGGEFLRRFLLHILPKGFMRIRHYGYLANRVRVRQLEKIREWIRREKPANKTQEKSMMPEMKVDQLMPCPGCKTGLLILRAIIPSEKERRQYVMV